MFPIVLGRVDDAATEAPLNLYVLDRTLQIITSADLSLMLASPEGPSFSD